MSLLFTDIAWEDYLYWQATDKKILNRLNMLLKEIQRTLYNDEPTKPQEDSKQISRLVLAIGGDNVKMRNKIPKPTIMPIAFLLLLLFNVVTTAQTATNDQEVWINQLRAAGWTQSAATSVIGANHQIWSTSNIASQPQKINRIIRDLAQRICPLVRTNAAATSSKYGYPG